ncbi:MAG: LysR family transcriptional regulator, partial [Janthinobacterium lividum]
MTKLFLRVAEAGSFSKAAHLAGITQSTVSKQIAVLEKRLGAQLVRRTSRGLALTAAGQHYYNDALR